MIVRVLNNYSINSVRNFKLFQSIAFKFIKKNNDNKAK